MGLDTSQYYYQSGKVGGKGLMGDFLYEPSTTREAYENLAAAVFAQAVEDWRALVNRKKRESADRSFTAIRQFLRSGYAVSIFPACDRDPGDACRAILALLEKEKTDGKSPVGKRSVMTGTGTGNPEYRRRSRAQYI